MTRYESQCVSCGFPCLYESCRYYKVKVLECDNCGDEFEKLYHIGDGEYCEQCALDRLEVVE